jgi:hypothetical protein
MTTFNLQTKNFKLIYLVFNVTKVKTAKRIPIIQNRVTKRDSGMPFF